MKMMLLLAFLPTLCSGMDRLSALSMIETGNNDRVVGKAGEISRYQILRREWRRVTRSANYTNPQVAKTVAVRLANQRVSAFKTAFKRPPTHEEFYALWNAPGLLLEGRLNQRIVERCRRFANLCMVE
jgi:hypothetical protein